MVLQAEEKDKTVQHILPYIIQYKNDREVDKGMDSLKLTVSVLEGCFEMFYKEDEEATYPPSDKEGLLR